MAFGVPLLHEQLSRVLGVDIFSPEGDRQVALAVLDIYSHALMSPELAASARAALGESTGRDRNHAPAGPAGAKPLVRGAPQ